MSRVFGERGGETRENFGAGLKYESRLNDGSIYIYLFSMVCGWSIFVWADCTLDLVCTVGLNMEVTRIESAGLEVKVIKFNRADGHCKDVRFRSYSKYSGYRGS